MFVPQVVNEPRSSHVTRFLFLGVNHESNKIKFMIWFI